MVPAGRCPAHQVPVEQHRSRRRHHHVAGVHVAVAHHGRRQVEPVPPPVTFDARPQRREGDVVDLARPPVRAAHRNATTGSCQGSVPGIAPGSRRPPRRARRAPSARLLTNRSGCRRVRSDASTWPPSDRRRRPHRSPGASPGCRWQRDGSQADTTAAGRRVGRPTLSTTSPDANRAFMPTRMQYRRGQIEPARKRRRQSPGGSDIGRLAGRRTADRRTADRRIADQPGHSRQSQHVDARVEATVGIELVLEPAVQLGARRDRSGAPARGCSWCTTPTPISATNRPVPGSDRQSAGRQRPAPAGRAARPADRRPSSASDVAWSLDVVGMALEQHPHRARRPTAPTSAGTARAQLATGRRVDVYHCSNVARGRVRRITSPMNPSVPREPTSSRHRSNPLTFLTVGPPALTISPAGVDVAGLQQRVADRPVAEPADPAAPDRERTADGSGRRDRDRLPVRRQRGVELVDRRAGAALDRHLLRLGSSRSRPAPSPVARRRPVRHASPARRS